MAIKQAATKTNTTAAGKDYEKAAGFFNIALPSKAGEQLRFHSVPLMESNVVHKQVIDFMNEATSPEDRAARAAKVMAKLVGTYNPVRTEAEQALDLS